jgi:hypothetical protein
MGGFYVHAWITNAAVRSEFVDEGSLLRLYEANNSTDSGPKYSNHALHFDSDAFQEGTQKLADNLNEAVVLLGACQKEQAIEKLGEALHALQDFYSHSNWIENHLAPGVVLGSIPVCTELVSLGPDGVFIRGSLAAVPSFRDTSYNVNSGTCSAAPGPPANTITSGFFPDNTRPVYKCTHRETNKDWITPADTPFFPDQLENPRGASTFG